MPRARYPSTSWNARRDAAGSASPRSAESEPGCGPTADRHHEREKDGHGTVMPAWCRITSPQLSEDPLQQHHRNQAHGSQHRRERRCEDRLAPSRHGQGHQNEQPERGQHANDGRHRLEQYPVKPSLSSTVGDRYADPVTGVAAEPHADDRADSAQQLAVPPPGRVAGNGGALSTRGRHMSIAPPSKVPRWPRWVGIRYRLGVARADAPHARICGMTRRPVHAMISTQDRRVRNQFRSLRRKQLAGLPNQRERWSSRSC
jgi:hypothetical protein